MPGIPIDAMYVWVGLSIASAVTAGGALAFHPAPAPAPTDLANTVDAVAASPTPTTLSEPIRASAVRIGPRRIAVRSDGGHASATYAYGPVTPVADGSLRRVLDGAPPGTVFETKSLFREALKNARRTAPSWQPAGERLRVRSVSWGPINATLVGA